MLVFEERGKPEFPEKNLSEQSREPTNSVHIWRRVRESNPGHIGGRRALSPLRQCYTPLLLYASTHTRFFPYNPCFLYLMLYCKLYSSTLLCYSFSTHIHLYARMILVLYCKLYACTVLRHSFSAPLRFYTSTPQSMPLRLYSSMPLHL